MKKTVAVPIFCLILLLFGCGLEIYLRIQYSKSHKELEQKYRGRDFWIRSSANRELIYEYIPNKSGVNSKGYKDYEYVYAKKDDTFRIIVIGDSVAEGEGVALSKSFPKVLEKRLNDNSENKKFEVIVLVRTGYSTSQELILLKKEAFLYHPDLIIWSYVLNDPAHPLYDDANGERGFYFFKPESHLLHYVSSKLFFIKRTLRSKNCKKEFHEYIHCTQWKEVESNIKEIGKVSKKKNTPIIFLIHPVFEKNAFKTYSLRSLHDKLARLASCEGLIVWDILDAYKDYNAGEIKQHMHNPDWYDPWHPNAKGHRIIADYLDNKLTKERFFER